MRISPTVPPVDQDDKDGEEGDNGGEQIGCRYTVEHHLSLGLTGRISCAAVAQGCTRTCSVEGVGVVAVKHQALGKVALPEATCREVRERGSQKSSSGPYKPSYRPCEKVKAAKRVQMSVKRVRGVDGLREDQEQTSDGEEEEVKEQQSPQEQEVGEHSGSKSSAQVLQGRVP